MLQNDPDDVTLPPDGRPAEEQPAWRTDFPIDWPADHYVERRDFMKFMVLISSAFAVGQFWIGLQDWIRRRRGSPPAVRLASVDDVPINTTHLFSYPTQHDPCVLVRPDEGTFLAYSQKCTHLSCAVVPRIEEGVIRCPCHAEYLGFDRSVLSFCGQIPSFTSFSGRSRLRDLPAFANESLPT